VVTTTTNWGALRQGLVVWLQVEPAQLLERLEAQPGDRPLLQQANPKEQLINLLQEREHLYAQADLQIAAGNCDPKALASKILAALPGVLNTPGAPQTTAP